MEDKRRRSPTVVSYTGKPIIRVFRVVEKRLKTLGQEPQFIRPRLAGKARLTIAKCGLKPSKGSSPYGHSDSSKTFCKASNFFSTPLPVHLVCCGYQFFTLKPTAMKKPAVSSKVHLKKHTVARLEKPQGAAVRQGGSTITTSGVICNETN